MFSLSLPIREHKASQDGSGQDSTGFCRTRSSVLEAAQPQTVGGSVQGSVFCLPTWVASKGKREMLLLGFWKELHHNSLGAPCQDLLPGKRALHSSVNLPALRKSHVLRRGQSTSIVSGGFSWRKWLLATIIFFSFFPALFFFHLIFKILFIFQLQENKQKS